jgi:protein SCO1/2
MGDLQRTYGDREDFRLVSITVDPETDTRETLKGYAEKHGAEARRWAFLRGEKAALIALARDGFKLTAATPGTAANETAVHSNRLVLVDRDLRIRGYYDGTDAAACALLERDAGRLLAEPR